MYLWNTNTDSFLSVHYHVKFFSLDPATSECHCAIIVEDINPLSMCVYCPVADHAFGWIYPHRQRRAPLQAFACNEYSRKANSNLDTTRLSNRRFSTTRSFDSLRTFVHSNRTIVTTRGQCGDQHRDISSVPVLGRQREQWPCLL